MPVVMQKTHSRVRLFLLMLATMKKAIKLIDAEMRLHATAAQ